MSNRINYIVSWDERHTITLEAKNEEEAKAKVREGNYPPESESAEINGSLEVDMIIIK